MPFVRAIRGRVGAVVFKTYGRKIVVTRVPRFDGYVPSAAQRSRRDRMGAATAYAKRIYADPAAKARYVAAAKKLRRHPFRLAVSDHLTGYARVAEFETLTIPVPHAFSPASVAVPIQASLLVQPLEPDDSRLADGVVRPERHEKSTRCVRSWNTCAHFPRVRGDRC